MIENKKVPKIRFKGFTEDWEQCKLKNVVKYRRGSFPQPYGKDEWYGGYGAMPFIQVADVGDDLKLVSETKQTISKIAQPMSVFIPKESVIVTLQGTIGRVAITQYDAYLDRTVLFFDTYLKKNINKYFWAITIKNKFESERKKAPGAIVKTITKEALSDFDISITKLSEQLKIGNYFKYLDNLITLHQCKCEKLVNVKKSVLEKMFPKNPSNMPEIRFKGFTEDWEQRRFDEMADYKKGPFGSVLKKDIFVPKSKDTVKVYEQQNAINKNWRLERYFITRDYANQLKSFETHAGDIIISCAGTIGEIYELPDNSETGIINQALMRVRVNEKIVSKDLYRIIFSNMIDDFSRERSNGSAIKNIPPFSDLKPTLALIPNTNEQNKISSFINNLDNLITLHQRKLEKLNNIKKSMLDKMFV